VTPVVRTAIPKVLQKNGNGWLTELQAAINELARVKNDSQAKKEDLNQANKDVEKARQKYKHAEVKTALVAMFYGKCAYCESLITTVTYGQIEHFYPKSSYINRTFSWHNLLLSCDICNDIGHKGTNFPIDVNGNPLLIDPTDGVTDPATHLKFDWDEQIGQAWVYGQDARGQEVVCIFDFNGRKELIKRRSKYVEELMCLLEFAKTGNKEAIGILESACQPDAPYRAFALAYIRPHLKLATMPSKNP